MARKLRRRLRILTPEERHALYCVYLDQWLHDEILEYELIARHGALEIHRRAWENLTEDQQFKALTIAQEALDQARKEFAEHAASA